MAITNENLTLKEEQFAVALVANGGKRKEAYLEVYGGDAKNPGTEAGKIVKKPHVAARVKQLVADELAIAGTTPKRVVAEVARIAFSNPLDAFDKEIYRKDKKLVLKDLDDIPTSLAASIKKVKSHAKGIEIEFHDKTRVLQDMQRRFGLLGDRKDAESQRVSVNINLGSDAPIKLTAAVVEAAPARQVVDVTPASPAAEEIQPDLEF